MAVATKRDSKKELLDEVRKAYTKSEQTRDENDSLRRINNILRLRNTDLEDKVVTLEVWLYISSIVAIVILVVASINWNAGCQ